MQTTPLPTDTPVEPFVRSLDAMGEWRVELEERVRDLGRFLREQGLLDDSANDLLDSLRQRLAGEKLIVAFVAEFSRGKSELINAIFFADAGRRIMPATPGRTTMCPVELGWDADDAPGLSLLPIETRLEGASLSELRHQPQAWVRRPVDVKNPESFSQALSAVTQVRSATVDEARALGLWNDDAPADNPPLLEDGQVEVPMWRHARINAPHPLLKRGLVVIDTPGLNAIGAEPELTVGLLPSAHVVVFVLGADTGVTKSDLEIWRDHLASQSLTRYVVLNKIDALIDPLSSAEVNEAQIASQCAKVAHTLDIPGSRIFPLSARQALEGRVEGKPRLVVESRLLSLEQALSQQLLPQRRAVFEKLTLDALAVVQPSASRSMTDMRRHMAEQLSELRGLRGKNGGKVKLMLNRLEAEKTEFEACATQLQALRAVHTRMLKDALAGLAGEPLKREVDAMIGSVRDSFLKLGAKRSFAALFADLRGLIDEGRRRSHDIREMLSAAFTRLNTDFGFSLAASPLPELDHFVDDLGLIERNYVQYLGLTQAMRLAQPRFLEQFRRMLMSRLRLVFEGVATEIELWNRTASAQLDGQLRERRRSFKRRRESLERIQAAASDLDIRLAELEQQDERLAQLENRLAQEFDSTRRCATRLEFGRSTYPMPASMLAPLAGLPTLPASLSMRSTLPAFGAGGVPTLAVTPHDVPALPMSSAVPNVFRI